MTFHELNTPLRRKNQQPEALLTQRVDEEQSESTDTVTRTAPTTGMDLSGVSTHGPDVTPAAEVVPETPAAALIVDDSATDLQPGQLPKTEFLRQLEVAVCAEAEAALAGTEHSGTGCPYLTFWFSYYQEQSSTHIENVIHRYAPETQGATTAAQYVTLIAARVRRGIERWAATGELTDVPEDAPIPETAPETADGVQHKERSTATRPPADPRAVRARLGAGRPLESGVRSRMEHAFGQSFAQVRTHTDPAASRISNEQNARAFTVGRHVAFGAGQYSPGTPVGDALIAHELVHVVQQQNTETTAAQPDAGSSHGSRALEEDADRAAVAAVTSAWSDTAEARANQPTSIATSLRSGLRLSRCGPSKKAEEQHALEYLQHLRTTGKIEAATDSKKNARKVVELWKQGHGQFILPATLKVLIVNELLNVPATDAGMAVPAEDQAAVATLLEGMTDREIETVMAKVGDKVIASALQGDSLKQVEERKKKVTPAGAREKEETFDAERLTGLRDQFIENAKKDKKKGRLECIQILSTQLEKLYEGPAELAEIKKGTHGYTKERNYRGRTLAESTLPNLMSRVEESNLVAESFVTDFARDPKTKQPVSADKSAWAGVTKMVGGVQGWHFFTMALMDGYHSVSLFVENRPNGMFLYWADQLFTTMENLVEPGSVAGFRQYNASSFDAYVLETTKQFWDGYYERHAGQKPGTGAFKPAGDSRTTLTIWKLRRTLPAPQPKPPAPAKPPAPTNPKPKRKRPAQ